MKRRVLVGITAAACVGGAAMGGLGCGEGATAASAAERSAALPVPKPIASGDYFPASAHHRDGIIHQWYPVAAPPVSFGDGVWAEPNGMTDFNGFVAQIFQGGTATDSDGKQYVVDVDNRVYVGEYVGTDGEHAVGAFCEI